MNYVRKLVNLDGGEYVLSYMQEDEPVEIRFDVSDPGEVFCRAAQEESFSDCTGVNDVVIRHGPHTYRYVGWQPGELFQFKDENGVIVWEGWFPSWEH